MLDQAKYLGLGKITKILYKKRSAFIPVIDSVVREFLIARFASLNKNSSVADILHAYKAILLDQRVPLSQIKKNLEQMGIPLSTPRIVSFRIWLEFH